MPEMPYRGRARPGRLAAVVLAVLIGVAAFFPGAGPAEADSIASPDNAGIFGQPTSVALDSSGFPVVAYFQADTLDLKILHCGNAACTSGNSITSPDTVGNVGQSASMVLDASGFPVVSYYDFTNQDLKVMHCNDVNCAGGDESITSPDTSGNVGVFTSIVLDASGFPVVSYFDVTNADLKILHCGNANCTSGNSITSPDTTGDVGRYTSIVLDASGFPVVSYYDATNFNLKVLHCGDANCTSGNSITSPDTTGDVGSHTSIVLDGSGFPVVSYYDATNADLKVLRCGNANCTSGNVITSPDTTFAGAYSSIILNASGFPVVSYSANGTLSVLRCGNATCSSGNTIAAPDPASDGQFTSIALDGAGFPVVSYYDQTTGDLKVLVCNTSCGGAPTPTPTATATATSTATVTATATVTPTGTGTPPPTATATRTSTPLPTAVPTGTPLPSATPVLLQPNVGGAVAAIAAAAGGRVPSTPVFRAVAAAITPPGTGDGGLAGP